MTKVKQMKPELIDQALVYLKENKDELPCCVEKINDCWVSQSSNVLFDYTLREEAYYLRIVNGLNTGYLKPEDVPFVIIKNTNQSTKK